MPFVQSQMSNVSPHAPWLDPNDLRLPTLEEGRLTHPGYPVWEGVAPLPHPRLMLHIGAESVENFFVVGDAWSQVIGHLLRPASHVLDIGCGCGRTARALLHHPYIVEYDGFDVLPASPEWCNRYLGPPSGGRFRFHHLDVRTPRYNPDGVIDGASAVFPIADGVVTLAFAGSLFTHLREPHTHRYLAETRRALGRGGLLIASIHDRVLEGSRYTGDEFRADIAPAYFVELAAGHGLIHHHTIPDLCGQRTFVFTAGDVATPLPAKPTQPPPER